MSSTVAVVLFVVGVIVAIMIHEWGHFVTARRFGMRADRFFLGFGPTLWSTHRGETEYGVKLLPAGGFVRIKGMSPDDERLAPVADAVFEPDALAEDRRLAAGESGTDVLVQPAITDRTWERLATELRQRGTPAATAERIVERTRTNLASDDTPAEARLRLTEVIVTEVTDTGRVGDLHHRLLKGDEGRFFADRPAWQRAIVLGAGSGMHFVQAFVLLFVGLLIFGQTAYVTKVSEFTSDSTAQSAGLQVGDQIVAINDTRIDSFDQARDLIASHPGVPLRLTVERDGTTTTVTATPSAQTDPNTGKTVGRLGFYPTPIAKPMPVGDALYETFVGPGSIPVQTGLTVVTLGKVFGPQGIGRIFSQVSGEAPRDTSGAVSIVGAAGAAGEGTAQIGPFFLFAILASINVFVGIFNLVPLPPLDGGHLAVLGIESAVNGYRRRRGREANFKVDPRAIATVAVPVIVILLTVGIALMWLDVTNPISIQ